MLEADEHSLEQQRWQDSILARRRPIANRIHRHEKRDLTKRCRINQKVLRREQSECLFHSVDNPLQRGSLACVQVSSVEYGRVAARVYAQQQRRLMGGRKMCGNDNRLGKRKVIPRTVGDRKCNMFPLHCGRKCVRAVKTQDVPAIINQHIEVIEEVFAQNATDTGVCRLEVCDVLDDSDGSGHGIMSGIE